MRAKVQLLWFCRFYFRTRREKEFIKKNAFSDQSELTKFEILRSFSLVQFRRWTPMNICLDFSSCSCSKWQNLCSVPWDCKRTKRVKAIFVHCNLINHVYLCQGPVSDFLAKDERKCLTAQFRQTGCSFPYMKTQFARFFDFQFKNNCSIFMLANWRDRFLGLKWNWTHHDQPRTLLQFWSRGHYFHLSVSSAFFGRRNSGIYCQLSSVHQVNKCSTVSRKQFVGYGMVW